MGIEVKVGDVFLIPLDGKSWALGQLVSAWHDELYVAIFDQRFEKREVNPRDVLAQKPLFLALTLSAKLYHGDWPIIGNVQDNLSAFPQPVFKIRQLEGIYIVSRDRAIGRPAFENEAEILRYRTVSYPALIQEAIQAYFGVCQWKSHFAKFQAQYAFDSSQLLKT